jgi:hypothetical protein
MIYLSPDEICGAARERKGRIHHRDGEDGRKTARKHLHLSSRRLSVSVAGLFNATPAADMSPKCNRFGENCRR